MSWLRISDDFTDRQELLELGDVEAIAGWTYIRLLCWSAHHLSDGVLPVGVIRREDPSAIVALERIEYVVAQPDGSYSLPRFLADHHPSKADVLDLRDKRAAAGRSGAEVTNAARAAANAAANADRQMPQHGARQTRRPVSRIPSPVDPVSRLPSPRAPDGATDDDGVTTPDGRTNWDNVADHA